MPQLTTVLTPARKQKMSNHASPVPSPEQRGPAGRCEPTVRRTHVARCSRPEMSSEVSGASGQITVNMST